MRYAYLKPELEKLSQGGRITFIRQFRFMTQDDISEKLGLHGECKRRSMARYERGDRVPKKDRLLEIANILNVNVNSIKQYDFNNSEDLIYILLWIEELYPRMNIDLGISECHPRLEDQKIKSFIDEWDKMREKRLNYDISYEEYMEWKFKYEVNEGDENEEDS